MRKILKTIILTIFVFSMVLNGNMTTIFGNTEGIMWYSEALNGLEGLGVIEEEYNYEGNITRGEVAYILYKIEESYPGKFPAEYFSEPYDVNPFVDIDEKEPYDKYLINLYHRNIYGGVKGADGNLYAMSESFITREDASTLITRAVNLKGFNQLSYKQFTDNESISDYAKISLSTCKDLGILQGYVDGTLKPKEPITKVEFLVMVYNARIGETSTNAKLENEGYRLSSFDDSLFNNNLEMIVTVDNEANSLIRKIVNNSNKTYSTGEYAIQLEKYIDDNWCIIPKVSLGADQVLYLVGLEFPSNSQEFSCSVKSFAENLSPGKYRLIQGIEDFHTEDSELEYIVAYFEI